jgi:hypothetical protein
MNEKDLISKKKEIDERIKQLEQNKQQENESFRTDTR